MVATPASVTSVTFPHTHLLPSHSSNTHPRLIALLTYRSINCKSLIPLGKKLFSRCAKGWHAPCYISGVPSWYGLFKIVTPFFCLVHYIGTTGKVRSKIVPA